MTGMRRAISPPSTRTAAGRAYESTKNGNLIVSRRARGVTARPCTSTLGASSVSMLKKRATDSCHFPTEKAAQSVGRRCLGCGARLYGRLDRLVLLTFEKLRGF